jgi:predicted AlkP superfamily phosphohydrolase/phosphomutase
MESGDLPNFKKLAEIGSFQSLATTNPAQSPVAWASFATGLNPGQHGIFDFIHRDPKSLSPVYSISGFKPPETFDLFGWQIPISDSVIYNKRIGKPFWLTAEQYDHKSSILRVPVTYPPDNNTRMLSGMGVPDLLGTQGTYTYYATKYIDKSSKGGSIVRVKVIDKKIETTLEGPVSPISGSKSSVPLVLTPNENSMYLSLDEITIDLKQGQWSEWIEVDFGLLSLNGMVRFYLEEGFPRVKLYASPIHINPKSPVLPISNPTAFASQLSDELGLFHTLGMPEETWSLNDGLIDSETYLSMVKTILAEREQMLFNQLEDDTIDLLVEVFVQTDRVSHMFWRAFDPNHAGYLDTNELERNAIKWIYQEADRILGKTMSKLTGDDKLIVISDHGFAPYYKHVNLNRWLLDEGFLSLKTEFFVDDFKTTDIDWSKTKAYAMGLNGIYLNLKNREENGIVDEFDAEAILAEISFKLSSLKDGQENVISKIYNAKEIYTGEQTKYSPDLQVGYQKGYRASWQTVLGESSKELFSVNTDKWSGDHCIDPQLVPGVLFTNFKTNLTELTIGDIGDLAMNTLSKSSMQKESKVAGLLDIPREIFLTFLNPLDDYLPSIIAPILAGFIFVLVLWLLLKVISFIPKIIGLKLIIKLLLVSFIVISYLDAIRLSFSSAKIKQGEIILINAIPIDTVDLPLLRWETHSENKIVQLEHNLWQIHLNDSVSGAVLRESDNFPVLEINSDERLYSRIQKQWWHSLLSNKGDYISKFSQVKKVEVSTKNSNQYWLLWFFLGGLLSIITAVILKNRKLKV